MYCSAILLASIPMIFAPTWHFTIWYNLYLGGSLTLVALLLKTKSEVLAWCKMIEHKSYMIISMVSLVIFGGLLFPSIFIYLIDDITDEIIRLVGVQHLKIIFSTTVLCYVFNQIKNMEYRSLVEKLAQQEQFQKRTQSQYDKVMAVKHYFGKLIDSLATFIKNRDFDGLVTYFDKYIIPIYKDTMQTSWELSRVKNIPIHNLLDTTAGKASTMKNITFEMDIIDDIKVPEYLVMEVFEILSNFIDNAFNDLTGQSDGLLRIYVSQSDNSTLFSVSNTLTGNLSIPTMYQTAERDDHRGFGLRRVRDLIFGNPLYGHYTYRSGMFGGKEILAQELHLVYKEEGVQFV